MKKSILCLAAACHVKRPLCESYDSQRPLYTSVGRSTHGVQGTTRSVAPGGVSAWSWVWFQKTPAYCFAMPHVRYAPKNQSLSFLIGPPRLAASSKIFTRLFAAFSPRARRSPVRLSLSIEWLL
ncbi:MAG: hypothetical protein DMF94_22700 [Acidobacteria bacterium]|nr:MAG: hypothetical protein DMF94_22700 [Acidobacteriota bacterium]